MKFFNFSTFSGVAGKGKAGGSGAFSLLGQPHSARTAPHVWTCSFVDAASGRGKFELMEPRSERHNLLRNRPVSSLTTCSICLDEQLVPAIEISTGMAPITVIFLPSAVRRVTLLFNRHDRGTPNFERMLSPAQRI